MVANREEYETDGRDRRDANREEREEQERG